MVEDPFEALRRDVSYLGRVLGDTLVEQAGRELFDLEETIRSLAKDRRSHEATERRRFARKVARDLEGVVSELDIKTAEAVARAFTHYFQLVNLAEQHHRIRRRRDYARRREAQPGALDVTFAELRREGVDRERFASMLARTNIELVFTAHPSEAQRRTVLEKHRRLVSLLSRRDRSELTPNEARELDSAIREEVATLWQTDEVRNEKPRVGDEVKNVLFYLEEVLFPLVPKMYQAIEDACASAFGEPIDVPCLLRFGSWVGADMDGNPNVTPDVAIDTALAQTARVLELYVHEVASLGVVLSQSTRRVSVSRELVQSIDRDVERMPELAGSLEAATREEPYRRKLHFVTERLRATRAKVVALRAATRGRGATGSTSMMPGGATSMTPSVGRPSGAPHEAPILDAYAYDDLDTFLDDLRVVERSLLDNRGARAGAARVKALSRQVQTFGFHLARLDVRVPAEWARADARVALGLPPSSDPIPMETLERALDGREPSVLTLPDGPFVGAVRALLRMREVSFGGGAESLILSMTHGAEDMLTALLLARMVGGPDVDERVAIVPLFETLDDLERAGVELARVAASPAYQSYLERRGRAQEVMVGYSDSNKDAGLLGSSFALYRAQEALTKVARDANLSLKIFHGRGGSIGRGGGPSQRAIESLPPGSLDGRFKLTEQGEVLGWKYLVPDIAERNLELTVGGVIGQSLRGERHDAEVTRHHQEIFEEVAAISVAHYRALVNDAGFVEYFASTTPIEEIPRLNIGSRPARRTGGEVRGALKLESLRAIPWVFAWTQSRQMVPGWYGAGRALRWLLKTHGLARAREMRAAWPFFASTLDALAVALAKADMAIGARYAGLMEDQAVARRFFLRIALDHARAVAAVRAILERPTHSRGTLASGSTLARSIELRNPYVDPLSFIQVELLRRQRALSESPPELLRAILLTINGVAAGLRTTG